MLSGAADPGRELSVPVLVDPSWFAVRLSTLIGWTTADTVCVLQLPVAEVPDKRLREGRIAFRLLYGIVVLYAAYLVFNPILLAAIPVAVMLIVIHGLATFLKMDRPIAKTSASDAEQVLLVYVHPDFASAISAPSEQDAETPGSG